MIGLRLDKRTIRQAFSKSRNFIGQTYSKTKGMLSDLDLGVKVAKEMYSIASPAMESILGENFTKGNKYVMNALSGYDDIRSKVMDGDENIKHHYNQIVGDMKKKNINIGL